MTNPNKLSTIRGAFLASAAGAAILALSASAALAQTQQSSAVDETVVVTGSHLSIPGFQSPTPVASISAEQIQLSADINVYDLENDIPALVPNSWTQQANANPGASNFNLRGLGINRTLTLVNGVRATPTSYDGTVDVNFLPVGLISRVDVVTGGASAAYGSDALGGVVNVILDTRYVGIKGSAQYGESQYGDEKEQDYTLTGGANFADGRGHIEVSAEVYANGGANQGQGRRPWANSTCCSGPALITNGTFVASGANGPKMIAVAGGTTFANVTEGGVIDSTVLKGFYFGNGGQVNTMTYGQYASSSTFMIGGSGGSFSRFADSGPQLARQTLYGRADYDITPDINVWADLLFAHTYGESSVTPNYDNATLTLRSDNYYLPAQVAAIAVANKITAFTYGRENLELGLNDPTSTYNDIRSEIGAKGKLFGDWTWDVTYEWSQNNYKYIAFNNRNQTNWLLATDVVANPANGQAICRSTLTNPTNGCVPANVFGINTINQAAVAYIDGNSWNYYHQQAYDFIANVAGTAFQDWAGPISVATGFEARRIFLHSTADAVSLLKQWRINNTQPFNGAQSVREGYFETNVPLLSGLPFAQLVSLNGAVRYTDYSLSGTVTTWKVGLDFSVNDDIRFRGTRSHDIRAPTLNDLFAGAGSQVGQVTDRKAGTPYTNTSYTFSYGTGGNANLKPEIGDTLTLGVVYSPAWLSGFQASLDYYRIGVSQAISSPGIQGVEDDCELYGMTNLCPFITRDATGKISFIQNTPFNAASLITDGWDIDAQYLMPVSDFVESWGGNLRLTLSATDIDRLRTTNVGVATDIAGGNTPHFHGNFRVTYTTEDDKLSASVLLRYTGGTKYNKLYVDGIDINKNEIPSRTYFNVDASYEVMSGIKLYAKVNNALNTTPPLSTSGIIEPDFNGNNQYYDIIGRTYAGGVRFSF